MWATRKEPAKVVAAVKASIREIQDYKNAIADGYLRGNPEVKQTWLPLQQWSLRTRGRPALRPHRNQPRCSTLRPPTPGGFKPKGVMLPPSSNATESELNDRIPLSMAHWRISTSISVVRMPAKVKGVFRRSPEVRHVRVNDSQQGKRVRRRMEPGYFRTSSTWMIHVFPYEDDAWRISSR